MGKFGDPFFWLFLIIGLVWSYRARRALYALDVIPTVAPLQNTTSGKQPLVTVIVPAKNEEKNIRSCVEALQNQTYQNLQILIVNDQSIDKTEAILQSMGIPQLPTETEKEARDKKPLRIAYLNSPPKPAGWTGKNFAIHCATPKAQGEWFLFTDADTRHTPISVASAVEHAESRDLDYLTLLPRCLTGSLIEDLIQPTAMGLLGLWFPMEKVNDPGDKAYFGNGQFLFIRKRLYQKIGGHEKVRAEFLEDYAITKLVKEEKAHFECAFGMKIYGTRMYDSFAQIWAGWRRIYLHAFQKNPWVILRKFFSVMLFSVLPFAAYVPFTYLLYTQPQTWGYAFGWGFGSIVILFILITCWKTYSIIKAKRRYALLHPVAAFFISMFLMDAFWMALRKQETSWR